MFDIEMLWKYAEGKKEKFSEASSSKRNAEEYAIFNKNYPNVVSVGEIGSYSAFELDR